MIPSKLILQNFRAHANTEINFNDFSYAVITGKINNNNSASNGAGKSAIFNAVLYVLFNYSKSSMEKVIRDNTDKCKVIFEFMSDNKMYRVERTRGRKAGGSDLSLFDITNEIKDLTQRRSSDTEKELAKLIKINFNTFTNSILFSQNDFSGLSTFTATKRKALLKDCLELGIYSKYETLIKKKTSDLTKDLPKKQALLESIGNPEEIIKESVALFDSNNFDLIIKNKEFQDSQEEVNEITIKINDLNTKLKLAEQNSASYSAKEASLNKELNELLFKSAELKSKKDAVKTQGQELNKEITDINKNIESLENLIKNFEYSNLTKELENYINKEISINVEINTKMAKKQELMLPLPKETVCKNCRQTISDSHRDNCQNSIQLDIASLVTDLESLNDTLHISKTKILEIKKTISSLQNNQAILNNLKNSLDKKQSLLSQKRSSYAEYEESLNSYKIPLENKQKELKEFIDNKVTDKQIVNYKTELYNHNKFISNKNLTISLLKSDISNLSSKNAVLNHKIEEAKLNQNKSKALKKELKDLEYNINLHQKVAQSFGPSGIPTLIVHTILDDLQIRTNDFLKRLRPGLQLKFNLVKDNQEDTFEIDYYLNSLQRDFEDLSGAQQLIVILSFKLAISSVIQKKLGSDIRLLLLDEADQAFDELSLETFVNIIKDLQKDFKILLITHNKDLKAKLHNHILVEQDSNGVSTAKFVS